MIISIRSKVASLFCTGLLVLGAAANNTHAQTNWLYGPFWVGTGTYDTKFGFDPNPLGPGWTTGGDPTTGSFARSTSPLYRGAGSLKGVASKYFTGPGYSYSNSVSVTPGQRYVLSGFIWRGAPAPGSNMYLVANVPGVGGGAYAAYSCPGFNNQWQFVYTTFDVPAGTTTINVGVVHDAPIYALSGETGSFDDIAVTPQASFVPPWTETLFVNRLTTQSSTPTITGKIWYATRNETQITSITALVNGVTYNASYNASDDTFSAYIFNALPVGTYDVIVTVNFNNGTTLRNSGCGIVNRELIITEQPFTDGVVVPTSPDGKIRVDYRYDGGSYTGQVGIFSLSGMGSGVYNLNTNAGQNAFVKEAVRRVLTNTTSGRTLIDDITSRARFNGSMPGGDAGMNHNGGSTYAVAPDPVPFKEFVLTPNQAYAVIMVPNGTFSQAAVELDKSNPDEASTVYPILSLELATDNGVFYVGQSVVLDVNNPDRSILAIEDQRGGDGDYNDIILRITGSSLSAKPYTQFITDSAWTTSTLGQQILNPLQ